PELLLADTRGEVARDWGARRFAVLGARLVLPHRAAVGEDGPRVAERPGAPAEGRHPPRLQPGDDRPGAVAGGGQLEAATHRLRPRGDEVQLAGLQLDPQGQAARHGRAALAGRLALALPRAAVAVALGGALAVAAHQLHGRLEEVARVGAVAA